MNESWQLFTAGVELDPAGASEEEKQAFAEYIALHKYLRKTLHNGDHFRCDTAHRDTQAWGVVSKDKTDAVFMFTQLALAEYALAAPLQPESAILVRLESID